VVPDRPACYPTRAAPTCRDALLGSLINITYSLSIGVSLARFCWVRFRATEPGPVGLLFGRRRRHSRGAKLFPTSALLEAIT
jgi:hypothetical protein